MNLRRAATQACAVALATWIATAQANEHQNTFSFALIGDQPYNDFFEPATDSLIQHIGNEPDINWILHVGDIKGGNEICNNELIIRRIAQLQRSEKPLVYVPGDNEWTDCHRPSNGNFNTQERLNFLRQQAFPQPSSLGKTKFKVRQQNSHPYPEHLMWTQGSTLFVSLNIPGSNNDLLNPKSRKTTSKKAEQLLKARDQAMNAWLGEAEALFNNPGTRLTETVIAIQGNPIDGSGGASTNPAKNGYAGFMIRLVKYIKATGRPVLLAHGDTHRFKWDKPSLERFGGTPETDALFYRVEGWGHPFMNAWVKVKVKQGSATPFEASSVSLPSPTADN
jgi:hypothetical protein